jgi:trimethylamine---corrinoid protein Co-methyltransferase
MDQACEDAPGVLSDLRTLEAFAANATTAYTCAPASMESARRWVEVAEIMAGGDLRRMPILTGYVAPISPLYLDRKAVEMMRLFVERGVLLRCGPCPIAGATSPYPLAGTLALSTAEVLLQVVVSQLLREGVAMTAAIGASAMDMRSGVCLYGGPVKELLHFASLEIIEHLGLPASMGVFSTICSNYGLQNGVESAVSSLSWFFRNHLLHGMGSLGNACGIGTEQILFHHDLMDMMEWMGRGIDCSEEKLALKSIQEVGPQGNFLTDESTVRWLRSGEHFQTPDFVYCQSGMDEGTLLENLHERAEQMIREHRPAVPEDRLERVRRYLHQEGLQPGV